MEQGVVGTKTLPKVRSRPSHDWSTTHSRLLVWRRKNQASICVCNWSNW